MTKSYPLAAPGAVAYSLMGLPLHPVDVWTLHQYIERVISRGEKALVLNLNVHCVNLALRHAWLAD